MNIEEILLDIPNEEYHKRSEWSSSDIKFLVNGCLDDLERHKKNFKPSKAMEFGTALHKIVLEKDTFFQEYIVMPEFEPTNGKPKTSGWKNTNDYKQQKEEFELIAGDRIILTEEEFNSIVSIDNAIRHHPFWQQLIENKMYFEKSIIGEVEYESDLEEDKLVKLPVRIRPDIIIPDYTKERGIIIDLKSTSDASPSKFGKDIYQLNYDAQASFYAVVAEEVIGKPFDFIFIACNDPKDNEEPIVNFYKLSPTRIVQGSTKVSNAIKKIESNERLNVGRYGVEEI